jgi:hypothetical protein
VRSYKKGGWREKDDESRERRIKGLEIVVRGAREIRMRR